MLKDTESTLQDRSPIPGIALSHVVDMSKRGIAVRSLFSQLEVQKFGEEWTPFVLQIGWGEDLGDLAEIHLAERELIPNRHVDLRKAKEDELADNLWSAFIQAHKHDISVSELAQTTPPFSPDDRWDISDLREGLDYYIGKVGKSVQAIAGVRDMENPREVLAQMLTGSMVFIAALAERNDIDLQAAYYAKMDTLEEKIKSKLR